MIRGTSSGLPASGIARNFFAAVISDPKAGGNGPAILTGIFQSQGHPFEARRAVVRLGNSADRARLYGGGESADLHPGLVCLPGSQSVLETPVVVFSSDREPCRRALSPELGRGGISISLGRELGGDTAQDFANRHPGLGFGRLRHPQRMEKPHGKVREAINAKLSGA